MSSETEPPRLAGHTGFTWAAILGTIAIVLGTIICVVIVRALIGYSITPVSADDEFTVTLGDRSVALWITPETADARCASVDTETQQSSVNHSTSVTMTLTDGGHTWTRVGRVVGPPGSTHTVTCEVTSTSDSAELLGHAPNPQVSHYLALGLVGGGIAGLSAVASVVVLIVTIVRRNRAKAPPA